MDAIIESQLADDHIQTVVLQVKEDMPVLGQYTKVQAQLVENGVLFHSVKLPVDGLVSVPAEPEVLIARLLEAAH